MQSKDAVITVAQEQVLRELGQTHEELVAEGWRWSEEDQDYAKPGNLEWDNGCGYGNIADDLEDKFGKVDFGYAGGCVNMVIDTESGHRINVTDAQQCFLTYLPDHTPAHGYSVGIYRLAEWGDGGDPLVLIDGYIGTDRLPKLIEAALRAVQRGECGHYYSQWGRSCGLEPAHDGRHRECEISWTDEMAKEPRR